MDLGISGKRAVVAASTSGLGLASAIALADAGCSVVINGRSEERLAAAAEKVPNAIPIAADISTRLGAAEFIDAATESLGGGVDILITNGGGPPPGDLKVIDIDTYDMALEMNLIAMATMVKKVVPEMQAQSWGRVVAITSTSVHTPIPNLILSNTARSGLTAFLKTTALEVVSDGVTINTAQPGLHLTPRLADLYGDGMDELASSQPTGRLGDPADFGQAVAFLCSEQANYITGISLPIDGGRFTQLQ